MSKSILVGSSFRPSRGGHAPGDVRDSFLEAIDAFENWNDGDPEPVVTVREGAVAISAVCGLLWNCRDTLPGDAFQQLCHHARWKEDEPRRQSYAAAARFLKEQIRQALA